MRGRRGTHRPPFREADGVLPEEAKGLQPELDEEAIEARGAEATAPTTVVDGELFAQLLEAQADDKARAFLCLMFFNGLRASEVRALERGAINLRWRQVNLPSKAGHDCLRISREAHGYLSRAVREAKGKAGRRPLAHSPRQLAEILQRCRAVAPAFPRGRGAGLHAFRQGFAALVVRALDAGSINLFEAASVLRTSIQGVLAFVRRFSARNGYVVREAVEGPPATEEYCKQLRAEVES